MVRLDMGIDGSLSLYLFNIRIVSEAYCPLFMQNMNIEGENRCREKIFMQGANLSKGQDDIGIVEL